MPTRTEASERIRMIYYLSGDNTFELQQKLDDITNTFVSEYGNLAVERVDVDGISVVNIIDTVGNLSFLSPSKLVILKGVADKELIERLLEVDVPEQNTVVVVLSKIDKRASYYKKLKSKPNFESFEKLPTYNLPKWIQNYAKANRGTISSTDARLLIDKVGENQMLLKSEIDKLIIYDSKISQQTIEMLVEPRPQSSTFDLLESAFLGDREKTERLYKEQRLQKVEPQVIIGLIGWQLHLLAMVKLARGKTSQEIASQSKIKAYSIQKSMTLAQKLSMHQINKLVEATHELDLSMKNNKVDADQAILLFMNRISFLG